MEGGVHPSRAPELLAIGKFSTDPAKTIGEDTRITVPDPNSFNRDISAGTVQSADERATLSIGIRNTSQASILLNWKNRNCRVDIFALSGQCGNPQDFTEGGEKWLFFPDGRISSHAYENMGAYGRDENNPTNESVDMTAEDYWELLNMGQERIGSDVTAREIYTVDVYTGNECENCPDKCDRILAVMAGANATPGTQPILLYSDDGGEVFSQQTIDTLFSNEDVPDAEIVGGDFVIITNAGNELHYTNIELLFDGSNSWSQSDSGFVVGHGPNAIRSADARHTWIVGDGGYIYFAKNIKTGVTVQDAGAATTQNLNAVDAYGNEHVLAVGDSNAVIYTENGGVSWKSVTGPAVGVSLGAVWVWDEETWLVGEGAGGNGKLWLTANNGRTWSEVSLPNTYDRIYKILFVSEAEGYISASAGGQSYVLRTITAGNEWVVLPQGKRAVAVDNTYLVDLAVCDKTENTAFAAGLAADGSAGTILKMSA